MHKSIRLCINQIVSVSFQIVVLCSGFRPGFIPRPLPIGQLGIIQIAFDLYRGPTELHRDGLNYTDAGLNYTEGH